MPHSRQPRIALATEAAFPDLWHEDRRLIPAMASEGIAAEPAVWLGGRVDWRAYDGVVIRSCWDYYEHYDAFLAWLRALDTLQIPVWNPTDVLRWNTDKRYLLELELAGIPILPTLILKLGGAHDLETLAAARGWERVVVKPVVSANGYDTHALSIPLDPAARAALEPMLGPGPVLVQPFAPEVAAHGEYSLVFIDGAYSHAMLKRPRSGEFRVQISYGGTAEPVQAPDWMIEQAANSLATANRATLYARVDGIVRDGRFLLMELELTEPNLYLEFAPAAVERLAAAFARELRLEQFFPRGGA